MHNLPADADLDEIEGGALKAVTRLKDEKVIGHFGCSGHSGAGILMEAIRRFDPDAVLTTFPCTRNDEGRYEDELLPLARERKMGVIAMKMVRHARNADLNGSDLIRYALGLEGICCGIVGLDTETHLRENEAVGPRGKRIFAAPRDGGPRSHSQAHGNGPAIRTVSLPEGALAQRPLSRLVRSRSRGRRPSSGR